MEGPRIVPAMAVHAGHAYHQSLVRRVCAPNACAARPVIGVVNTLSAVNMLTAAKSVHCSLRNIMLQPNNPVLRGWERGHYVQGHLRRWRPL